jgi:tRNA 2-thiouridine synthesizing protein A
MSIAMPEKKVDKIVDLKGLLCPMPTVIAKKAIECLEKNEILELLANDSTTRESLPLLCKEIGCTLIEQSEDEGVLRFLIRK